MISDFTAAPNAWGCISFPTPRPSPTSWSKLFRKLRQPPSRAADTTELSCRRRSNRPYAMRGFLVPSAWRHIPRPTPCRLWCSNAGCSSREQECRRHFHHSKFLSNSCSPFVLTLVQFSSSRPQNSVWLCLPITFFTPGTHAFNEPARGKAHDINTTPPTRPSLPTLLQ